MEIIISSVAAATWIAVLLILGMVGHISSQKERKLEFLMKKYKCTRATAMELEKQIRRAKAHTIYEDSGVSA